MMPAIGFLAVGIVSLGLFLWFNRSGQIGTSLAGLALWLIFAVMAVLAVMEAFAPTETPVWFRLAVGFAVGLVVYAWIYRHGKSHQAGSR